VYVAYRLIKGILLLVVGGVKNFHKDSITFYNDYEEEIKDNIGSSISSFLIRVKSSAEALKQALPKREGVTTGRKTIKQVLVRVSIIFSLWVISLVLVIILIASNFNFAMGMY